MSALDEIRGRYERVDALPTISRGVITVYSSQRDVAPLLAAVEAVEKLHIQGHKKVEPWAKGYRFTGEHCTYDGEHWPCATVEAIATALGGAP